jgi:hypothetical protein
MTDERAYLQMSVSAKDVAHKIGNLVPARISLNIDDPDIHRGLFANWKGKATLLLVLE